MLMTNANLNLRVIPCLEEVVMVLSEEIVGGGAPGMCRIVVITTAILMTYGLADFNTERTRNGPGRTRPVPCPVVTNESALNDTESEVTAQCVCAPTGDIRCHGGVRAVPKLVVEHLRHAQSSSFAGFYAAGQQIGGLAAFAFADLSVDRIVLNFNPIGHRQACIDMSNFVIIENKFKIHYS